MLMKPGTSSAAVRLKEELNRLLDRQHVTLAKPDEKFSAAIAKLDSILSAGANIKLNLSPEAQRYLDRMCHQKDAHDAAFKDIVERHAAQLPWDVPPIDRAVGDRSMRSVHAVPAPLPSSSVLPAVATQSRPPPSASKLELVIAPSWDAARLKTRLDELKTYRDPMQRLSKESGIHVRKIQRMLKSAADACSSANTTLTNAWSRK